MDAERIEENVQCWQKDQTVSQTVCFPSNIVDLGRFIIYLRTSSIGNFH